MKAPELKSLLEKRGVKVFDIKEPPRFVVMVDDPEKAQSAYKAMAESNTTKVVFFKAEGTKPQKSILRRIKDKIPFKIEVKRV